MQFKEAPQQDWVEEYIQSISSNHRAKSELEAFKLLCQSFSDEVIKLAFQSVVRNGLPPFGKLTLDPLADLAANGSVMKLFQSQSAPSSEQVRSQPDKSL